MSSPSTPQGPGSVSGAPNLPMVAALTAFLAPYRDAAAAPRAAATVQSLG